MFNSCIYGFCLGTLVSSHTPKTQLISPMTLTTGSMLQPEVQLSAFQTFFLGVFPKRYICTNTPYSNTFHSFIAHISGIVVPIRILDNSICSGDELQQTVLLSDCNVTISFQQNKRVYFPAL